MTFDVTALRGDVKAEWTSMLRSLKTTLVASGAQHQVQLGGWKYFDAPIGNCGVEYDYRAMIALGGLGANPIEVAIYPKTDTDASGAQLNGGSVYKLHFEKLPVGTADFHLFLRIHLPDMDALGGGWEAPTITKIS